MTTTVDRIDRITRRDAPALAAAEYDRMLDLLRTLDAGDWARPTDCPAWDVRQMVAHLLGAAESCASLREQLRQTVAGSRLAKARGVAVVDGINEVQVRARDHLAPAELVERYAQVAPRAVRGRRRVPGAARRISVGDEHTGALTLGTLVDVTYTRDTWMHRVDICRTTGRDLVLTADHDGRIVADVVAEWAALHGQPFDLHLAGPAGGHYVAGAGGPRYDLDAVEFCRTVSGRVPGDGLLATPVLF